LRSRNDEVAESGAEAIIGEEHDLAMRTMNGPNSVPVPDVRGRLGASTAIRPDFAASERQPAYVAVWVEAGQ